MELQNTWEYISITTIWMGWNLALAVVPIILANTIYKAKGTFARYALLSLWLLFLPNTLYLVTDGMYVYGAEFTRLPVFGKIISIWLFAGIMAAAPYTYFYALKPVFLKYKIYYLNQGVLQRYGGLLLFAQTVALGVTMGRFARTNSWYIFTDPMNAIGDAFVIFQNTETFSFFFVWTIGIYSLNILYLKIILKLR